MRWENNEWPVKVYTFTWKVYTVTWLELYVDTREPEFPIWQEVRWYNDEEWFNSVLIRPDDIEQYDTYRAKPIYINKPNPFYLP